MKQILFFILFATLFVACDKDSENLPDLTTIGIKERPCETLEYIGRIGNDFDTALDSLRRLKNISSEIIKEPLEVLFDYDNRQFFGITYGDCGVYSDVLDTKGNYYLRTWCCPDENNADIQEEDIFKEKKIFTIDNGCATITYQSRIGNDFDSALDSFIKKYEPILDILATEGHYSGEGYNIDKEKVNVDFGYDNREFKLLTFTDKANIYRILFSGDVIDEKGNHYIYTACED
ncbi:hypothetical protein FACS1894178_7840 [Bacteroidia bacterium]|nr:hypothetical protein FACS1894178_7840 [Bacteroidia bacterium]